MSVRVEVDVGPNNRWVGRNKYPDPPTHLSRRQGDLVRGVLPHVTSLGEGPEFGCAIESKGFFETWSLTTHERIDTSSTYDIKCKPLLLGTVTKEYTQQKPSLVSSTHPLKSGLWDGSFKFSGDPLDPPLSVVYESRTIVDVGGGNNTKEGDKSFINTLTSLLTVDV